jgi:Family of unknown function (DUF5681)
MPRKAVSGVGGESDADGLKVGYGRPPLRTRFKPGVSGNPKGRPKWSEEGQLTKLLTKELFRPLSIQQNGSKKFMPALQIGLRSLMISGAKGDAKAVMASLKLAQMVEHDSAVQKGKSPPMTNQERVERILQLFEKAQRRKEKKDVAKLAKETSPKQPLRK